MANEFIFYSAGNYARINLETWVSRGIVPVCFADSDTNKHYQKISPYVPEQTEFEILSLKEALMVYPESDVYITLDPLTDAYKSIFNYILGHGVPSDRIGPVPESATDRQCIFYAAGRRAELNLKEWVFSGIAPVCFADSDESKHHSKISIPPSKVKNEFDILPLWEALERYPEAFLYITSEPESYKEVYDRLVNEGVPSDRIGGPPQHCPKIGHYLLLNGLFYSACCLSGYAVFLPTSDNIKEDVERYYEYCERLRNDLNEGKLTSCTGCVELRPGRSDEELKIKTVNLATGLPGGGTCNFKCCYCNYGQLSSGKFRDRTDNVLEILQFFEEEGGVNSLHYEAGEITISPYATEMLEFLKEKKWKGRILSNGSVYKEELKDLLSKGLFTLNVSLDSGTPETFSKVKGVDYFNEVVENLEKYAEAGGKIQAKYIVLGGFNCGDADIDGFILIAKRLGAKVIISRNNTTTLLPMPDNEYEAVLKLARRCVAEGIPYFFEYLSGEYRDRLKSDGVYK